MTTFYLAVACFLLVTMLAGLARVFWGPQPEDRVMAMQLFGTTGVAVLLLMAEALEAPAVRNVALLFALLAALAVAAFVGNADGRNWKGD
jgi:multicomponent Na+:H+ antiporter subunit F